MTTTATMTEQPMTTRRTRSSTSWYTSRPNGRPTAAPASRRSATGRSVWRRPVQAWTALVNVARNSATTTASWAPTAIDSSGTAVRPNPNPAASCTVAASATASAAPVRPAASRCTLADQAPAQSATTGVSSSSSRRVSASGCTSGVGAACTMRASPSVAYSSRRCGLGRVKHSRLIGIWSGSRPNEVGQLAEPGDVAGDVHPPVLPDERRVDRAPLVAVLGGVAHAERPGVAHRDRDRTAARLRVHERRLEAVPLAGERHRLVPAPAHAGAQRGDPLAPGRVAPVERHVGAVVLELLDVPAHPDAEQQAAAAQDVERRRLARQVEDVVLEDQGDAGGEHEVGGHRRRRGQRHQRAHHVVVATRQVAAGRVRRAPRGRDVAVLRHPQRVEAALLELDGEGRRMDAGGGVHGQVPELHGPDRRRACRGIARERGKMGP